MNVTCIGDIHGRTDWIDIVNKNKNNNFIFLGDYVDPYHSEFIEEEEAIVNLEAIIDFKKNNSTKVSLLIGNHDAQYLFDPSFKTSYRSQYSQELTDLYYYNKSLFQFALQKDRYLFTHAGISNDWFNEYHNLFNYFGLNSDMSNLAIVINKIGKDTKWREVFGDVSFYRGGFDNFGSLIWADRRELEKDYLTGFHQIVGHNKVNNIIKMGDATSSITFIDCLWSKPNSLTLSV